MDATARYEFRVWAETLGDVKQQLQRFAMPSRAETSEEIYLISATTDGCNAKIRHSLVDIKILIATDRGLEQWIPVLKTGFPLESSVISAQIFPSLKLEAPQLSKLRYEKDDFLDEVISMQRKIEIVQVSKTRLQFALNTCQAEFASATINGLKQDTVAVEAADPDAVLRLIREIGINGAANISYIRWIKQILGRSSAPSAD